MSHFKYVQQNQAGNGNKQRIMTCYIKCYEMWGCQLICSTENRGVKHTARGLNDFQSYNHLIIVGAREELLEGQMLPKC